MPRLESRFDAMEKQFGELRARMAHLEGLLERLREAITGRAAVKGRERPEAMKRKQDGGGYSPTMFSRRCGDR